MISISELRIGNLISVHKKQYRVIYLSDKGCGYDGEDLATFENLQPIPIQHDWLTRMKFVKDEWGYKGRQLALNQYDDFYHLRIPQGTGFGRGIRYIHQLQNLYFEISGMEISFDELPI